MNLMMKRLFVCGVMGVCAASAWAEILDRSGGFKIGERMTLRPYVSASLTYDSNVHSRHGESDGDAMWTISPMLGLSYDAETWSLLLTGYYNYHQYFKSENRDQSRHNYGQDLRWNWSNSVGGEKGWSLILGESYQQITMADDMTLANGQNYGGDSRQFQFSGALQRNFNQYWHASVNGSYYWLDYDNDTNESYSFYGWNRWLVGAEAGFAPSPWTDFIISGSYTGYEQDNASPMGISNESSGFSLQAGIGSRMTDRISYRLLVGWSRFEYGKDAMTDDGFVYTATANWKIGESWNTMLLATSYYQPSERQLASASRVDALSWGLAKQMVRGKLRATLDLRYRRETQNYALSDMDADYVLNIITGRIGLNYSLNRFLSAFANAEVQRSLNSESDRRGGAYDYNRWRVTCGVSLSY